MSDLTGYIETTKIQPVLEDLVITPSKEEQNFKSKVDGYDKVRVNGVPFEALKVEPSKDPQVFDGVYDKVEVEAITGDNLTITPSKEEQSFNGLYENIFVGKVTGDDLTITPSKKEQSFNGLYENVFVEKVTGDDLNITPTEEEQSFNGLYENVNVEAISTEEVTIDPNFSSQNTFEVVATEGKYIKKATVNKDVNLVPEVVLDGHSVYGIDGTFKPLDTSDATATAEDIAKDKTAYVNGKKVTGTTEISDYNAKIDSNFSTASSSNLNNKLKVFIRELNVDDIDFTIWTSLSDTFSGWQNITKITGTIDNSKNTALTYMFSDDINLIECPAMINTEKVTSMDYMFANCPKLKKIYQIDASSIYSLQYAFNYCSALEDFGGLLNLGKGYKGYSANSNGCKLDLSTCTKLTHESLMNVINGLYDLNLTCDVANGGTLARQKLVLGSTNLAKLTADEKAIATNKGWTVS